MKRTSAERTSRRMPVSLGKSNTDAAALVPNGIYPDPPPADALSNDAMAADVMNGMTAEPAQDSRADGDVLHARIAERAYHLYLSRNDAGGDALNDWLRAEAEVRSETT